jgi:hypothetical protein
VSRVGRELARELTAALREDSELRAELVAALDLAGREAPPSRHLTVAAFAASRSIGKSSKKLAELKRSITQLGADVLALSVAEGDLREVDRQQRIREGYARRCRADLGSRHGVGRSGEGHSRITERKAPEDAALDPHASAPDDELPTCDSGPHRGTKVDIERRRARISELLGRGLSGEAIVRRIAAEDGIGERQARTHVTAVRKAWAAVFAAEEPHRRAQLLAYLDAVAAAAFEDRAWGACVAAAREFARVLGLDRMTVKVEGPVDSLAMSPVEREAEIAELLKRREAALGRHDPSRDTRTVGRREP